MKTIRRFFAKLMLRLKKLSKKQKRILGIVLIIIIAISLAATFIIKNDEESKETVVDNSKVTINDSEGIIKQASYDGLTINNIILLTKGNYSTFTATVTNNGKEDKKIKDFDIVLRKGEQSVVTLYAYIGGTLKKGESREITASVKMKLPKKVVDNVIYEKHK